MSISFRCGQLGREHRFSASNSACCRDLEAGVISDTSVIRIVILVPPFTSPPESVLDGNNVLSRCIPVLLLRFGVFEETLGRFE